MAILKPQLKHALYAARAHIQLAEMHFGVVPSAPQKAALDLALVVSAAWEAGAAAERLGAYFPGRTHLDDVLSGAAEYMAEPPAREPVLVMGSPVFYACRGPCCALRARG